MKKSSSRPIPTGRLFLLVPVLLIMLSGSLYGSDQSVGQVPTEDEGSLIEELIALPVNGLYNALKFLGFKGFEDLIFNNTYGDLAPFTPDEWRTVMAWYGGIRDAVWALLAVAVAVKGWGYMRSSYNPEKRVSFLNSVENVIYAFAVILFMPYAVQVIFQLNNYLVALFKGMAQSMGVVEGSFNLDDIKTGSIIATAVVKLGYLGLLVFFNFLYLIRKFVLTSMLVVTPIVAWTWTISGRKEGIGIVLGEVASNAFMQASHALVLALYLTLLQSGIASDFSPWWAQIFGMVCLIPTSNVIRNLLQGWLQKLGVNEEGWAGAAAMGFAGLANIAKTTVSPKPVLSGITGGGSRDPGSGSGEGGSGLTKAVSAGVRFGSFAGNAGRLAGGFMGAAMSIPLKTAGIDLSPAGSSIGSFLGTAGGRQMGTGWSVLSQGLQEGKEAGSFIQGLGKTVGMDKVSSELDAAEVLGRAAGASFGAAGGFKGARVGQKLGGALGRYGLQTAGFIFTANPDRFRWN